MGNRAEYEKVLGDAIPDVTIIAPSNRRISGCQGWRITAFGLSSVPPNPRPWQLPLSFGSTRTFAAGSSTGAYTTGSDELKMWALTNLHLFHAAMPIARETRPAILGALEVYASGAAYACSLFLRKPFFTKFQGTILYPYLDKRWSLPGQVLGLRVPAQGVFMTNDGTRGDEVLRALGVRPESIHFAIDGVRSDTPLGTFDRAAFLCRELGFDAAEVGHADVLLCASVLTYWKRVDRAIRMMAEVVRERPHAHLVILGVGSTREALAVLACELGVERNVHFMGSVPHEKVREFNAAAEHRPLPL